MAKVIRRIATFTNIPTTEETVTAWHDAIGDLDFLDTMRAVTDHYGHSREWLMPAVLRAGVADIELARSVKVPGVEVLMADVDPREPRYHAMWMERRAAALAAVRAAEH